MMMKNGESYFKVSMRSGDKRKANPITSWLNIKEEFYEFKVILSQIRGDASEKITAINR